MAEKGAQRQEMIKVVNKRRRRQEAGRG